MEGAELMKSRRWIILYGLFAFFILTILLGNFFVKTMLKEVVMNVESLAGADSKRGLGVQENLIVADGLLVDDPSDVMIFVQKKDQGYRSELQWEFDMKQTMFNSKVIEQMDQDQRIAEFKDSAAEFNKRMRRIDNRIQFFENEKQRYPKNSDISDKLQNLYMLKSTMSVFKDKILIDSYKTN